MESESTVSKLAKRTIKNQAIIRGSGFVGAGMQKVGVGLIAESVRRSKTPMIHKTDYFEYNPKSFFRESNKKLVKEGRVRIFRSDWKPNPKTTYARRTLFGKSEVEQHKRWQKKRTTAEVRRVQTPRRIGIVTITLGKGLPVLASGYVGYQLLMGEDVAWDKPKDPWGATELVELSKEELPGVIQQQKTILGQAADYGQGLVVRSVAFGLVNIFA